MGHSFVRRLRDGLVPPLPSKRGQDIPPWNTKGASHLASAWGISDHVRGVYTYCDGVVRIRDIDIALSTVRRVRPGVVLIDIGSNDLAHVDEVNPNLMLRLVTQLTDFALALPTSKVVLNAILPRTGNITCAPEVFRENAEHFNNFLFNICDPPSKIVFHRPRGFWMTHVGGKERVCEVHEWSTDGIHCNMPASMGRYRARTRRAVLAQIHSVRETTEPRSSTASNR